MTAPAPLVTKLRPIVQVTPTSHGLHARGWSSTVTISGGPALARLWELVEARLADGISGEEWCPVTAPAPVRAAVDRIREQLAAHDMLVDVPVGWDDPAAWDGAPSAATASWLESVADDPAATWARLRAARIAVQGGGPVAWAALRALEQLGLTVSDGAAEGDAGHGTDRVVVVGGGRLVVGGADDAVGVVLPALAEQVGPPVYAAVAARVGMGQVVAAPTALHSLVGSAAAHRLVCAVGGLPDPGQARGGRPRGDGGWAAATVLVARMDPLRAAYHPWLGTSPSVAAPVTWVQDASVRLAALTDPELGAGADHDRDCTPQVPAALQALRSGAHVATAVAPTSELARVTAGCALVEQLAADRLGRRIVAGSSPVDAAGRALREAWLELPTGHPVPEAAWSVHPAARRWWKALTLHFAAEPRIEVDELAEGVFRAVASARTPGWAHAVEATAGDAAAMAALALVGQLQQAEADPERRPSRPVAAPTGASPSGVDPAAPQADWDDDAWSWPSRLASVETALQQRLVTRADGRQLLVRAVTDRRVADLAVTHTLVEVIHP